MPSNPEVIASWDKVLRALKQPKAPALLRLSYPACERSKTVDKNKLVARQYQVNWKQKTQMQMQILLRKWLSLRKQPGLRMMNFVRKNIHAVYSFVSVAYQRHTRLVPVWYGSFEPRSTEMNQKQSIGSQFIWSLVQSVTDLCRRWN